MNLGVFNKVNSNQKEDRTSQWERMYSDWSSFSQSIQSHHVCTQSVLLSLPLTPDAAKNIVGLVVQPVATTVGQSLANGRLQEDKQVDWCMEVICYGLSLPLVDHETIRHCVHIYCEWLTALLPQPKQSIPQPVLLQPNFYARKMISHLYHLFIPRADEAADVINRQAVLCHRVLRTIQAIVQQSSVLERDTWEALLLFLLSINDALLSPPTILDDIGDQLCDRVLGVLLEVWLQACARCFPSPRLWKTLSELAQTWRHRTGLVTQWNRINAALTAALIKSMYGSSFPQLELSEDDKALVPANFSSECLAQTWYRVLHFIGNPVTLARPSVISQTPKFLQFAINSLQVVDPSHHPCLAALPAIFVKAMKGIATLVDAFLGICKAASNPSTQTKGSSSLKPSAQSSSSNTASYTHPAANRPRCNSVLHMFGAWLFEAALLGCEAQTSVKPESKHSGSSLLADRSRASSVSTSSDHSVTPAARPRSSTVVEAYDQRNVIPAEAYENGRAEAVGALCRIFCAKKSDEDILPVYLARFYIVLHHALRVREDRVVSEAMASVIMHATDLFRIDLDGVSTILLPMIDALDLILSTRDVKIRSYVNRVDLRRASIQLLSSILVLPLTFQQLPIKELVNDRDRNVCTFAQLRPRLTQLVITALQVESDPVNTQLLLGDLALLIQDVFAYEQSERSIGLSESFSQLQTDSTSNILSSASDTHSCHSVSSTSYPSLSEHTLETSDVNDASLTGSSFNVPVHSASLWSPQGLFTHTTHLVCSKLLSAWKSDLNVSLAALEMLSVLARLRIADQDVNESRRVVKWLCDYISVQCSKPPPAHSKDLHSTIVAAFHCCAVWLVTHPYLASDYDCLHHVLQVTELGISGSKSLKTGEPARMKQDKELKPVSLRVRDAAELLLTSLVEQVGHFPSLCGARSVSCLIDEETLAEQLQSSHGDNSSLPSETLNKFRLYALDGATVLSILDEPLEEEETQPTATLLVRNPFGRQAWTMQLRHLPRHKCGVRTQNSNPGRPLPMNENGRQEEIIPQYFPETVDRVRMCLADKSIPSMDSSLVNDDRLAADVDKLGRLMDTLPSVLAAENFESNQECTPPVASHEFQTARLLLSHLGLLSVSTVKDASVRAGSLVSLDSSTAGFWQELKALDQMANRTYDTLHVFYVRSGQKSATEILSNMVSPSTVHPHFREFLHSLGWPVKVSQHPGWTGHLSTSWKVKNLKDKVDEPDDDCGSAPEEGVYNGKSKVLYWADAFSEIACVVPTPSSSLGDSSSRASSAPKSLELAAEPEVPQRRRTVKQGVYGSNPEFRMMAVWVESYEDCLTFPIEELVEMTPTGTEQSSGHSTRQERASDCFVVFIHALHTGLYRIHLRGPQSRINLASPLVDGMVVSRRVLGAMVRHTALNMAKRRRLDHDSHQPPHVRRKLRIQEFAQRYRAEMETPEFLTRLFTAV